MSEKEITNIPISGMFRTDPEGQASINLLDPPPSYSDLQWLYTIIYSTINDPIVSYAKSGGTLLGTEKNGITICNSSRRLFKHWGRVARKWGKILCNRSIEPNLSYKYRTKDREVITLRKAMGSLLRLKLWPEILTPLPPGLVPREMSSSFRWKPPKCAADGKLPRKSMPIEFVSSMRLTVRCSKSIDLLKTFLVRRHCLFDKALPEMGRCYTYKKLTTGILAKIGMGRKESPKLNPHLDTKIPPLSALIGQWIEHGYESAGK